MIVAASVAVPVIRVHRNIQKRDGLLFQGCMKQNRNIGNGIVFGNQCDRPRNSPLLQIVKINKKEIYKVRWQLGRNNN